MTSRDGTSQLIYSKRFLGLVGDQVTPLLLELLRLASIIHNGCCPCADYRDEDHPIAGGQFRRYSGHEFGDSCLMSARVIPVPWLTYPWLGTRDFEVEVQATTWEHLHQHLQLAHLPSEALP